MIAIAAANIREVSTTERADIQRQALAAASAAASKKGEAIVVLDVGPILAITDYFVIASGTNDRQVRTIVDEVERQLKDRFDIAPLRVEGAAEGQWVLMDYGDFWVHVFLDETRHYYELERLWSDAARVPFRDTASGASTG
ncbi:MAG TPA: ribosome silencing factor [Acidimicrobiia bacterium]|nr:ribosome silencing factor [Acidimicrobiia bacterium]